MNREEALSQKCIQNRDTLTAFRDHLTKPSPKVEWLLKAGPIAKRLNEESTRGTGLPNKRPVSNSMTDDPLAADLALEIEGYFSDASDSPCTCGTTNGEYCRHCDAWAAALRKAEKLIAEALGEAA